LLQVILNVLYFFRTWVSIHHDLDGGASISTFVSVRIRSPVVHEYRWQGDQDEFVKKIAQNVAQTNI
jgi:hypothetical protein